MIFGTLSWDVKQNLELGYGFHDLLLPVLSVEVIIVWRSDLSSAFRFLLNARTIGIVCFVLCYPRVSAVAQLPQLALRMTDSVVPMAQISAAEAAFHVARQARKNSHTVLSRY